MISNRPATPARELTLKQVLLSCAAGLAMGVVGLQGAAQTAAPRPLTAPQAPAAEPTPAQTLPKAPANPFPPADPKNFTAKSPTVDTVNSFLHSIWGFDENRQWSVAAIEPTMAPGVVQVHVLVSEKTQPGKLGQTTIFITPDGKHAIAGDVVNFGAQPFEETRTVLQQRAEGPTRGAAGKELEFVYFTDLQCPNCKTAQSTIDQLMQDFPQAKLVFEDMPLSATHPFAFQAATVGHCVRKAKGDAAFFTYVAKVYAAQADLTKEKVDATLRAAVTAAGADAAAVMSCASSPAAQDAVNAVIKLGTDIGVTNVPTLVVNGRAIPLNQVAYDALAKVIVFQGSLDGVTVHQQPRLSTLK